MAVTAYIYRRFGLSLAEGKIDFDNHDFRAMLVGPGYTPNQGAHQFKNSITNEIVGSGYSAGGQLLTGVQADMVGNNLVVPCGNLSWPSITFTNARYLVVYDDEYPTQATKPLVCYIDFGENKSAAGQAFYYNFPGGKLLELVVQ